MENVDSEAQTEKRIARAERKRHAKLVKAVGRLAHFANGSTASKKVHVAADFAMDWVRDQRKCVKEELEELDRREETGD